MKVATVKSLSNTSELIVPISSDDKPQISNEILVKWQHIIDLTAKIMGVPSGLITRITKSDLEVLLTNQDEVNIFKKDDKFELGAGWYCENVVGQKDELVLPNAYKDEKWKKDNPSLPFNMISYMGIPIVWPDGEVFGTFCVLDNKENSYSEQYKDLLKSLREIIQEDLKSTLFYQKVQKDLENKDYQIREVHHRVKNHFTLLLSTLNLQSFIGAHESPEAVLSEIQARIYAISSIHDKLYLSTNLEDVSLLDYLGELGKFVINNLSENEISYICSGENIKIGAKTSLPCGLLLNELLINSLKYAFKNVNEPEINLSIQTTSDSIQLLYRDNGKGIDESLNIEKTQSLGIILIRQLVLQLGGTYKVYNDNGFVFKTTFPIAK